MKEHPRFKIVTLVFIQRDDSVLLVKQSYGNKLWSLPGGYMENGESVEEGAIREVREETGLEVKLKRLVGVYTNPVQEKIIVTFEGEIVGGELKHTTNETSETGYFALDKLPEPRWKWLAPRFEDFNAHYPYSVFRKEE